MSRTFFSNIVDLVIRKATSGIYSHVEIIPGRVDYFDTPICYSSSARDKGVRSKPIYMDPEKWKIIHCPEYPESLINFVRAREGLGYDYVGIILSQFLSLTRHSKKRWFCSEICAKAIGLPNAHRISPQLLYDILEWRYSKRE